MRSAGAGLEPQVRVMRSPALEPQIRVMRRAGEEPRLGRSPQLRVMRRSAQEEEGPQVRIVRTGDMQKMTGGGW